MRRMLFITPPLSPRPSQVDCVSFGNIPYRPGKKQITPEGCKYSFDYIILFLTGEIRSNYMYEYSGVLKQRLQENPQIEEECII